MITKIKMVSCCIGLFLWLPYTIAYKPPTHFSIGGLFEAFIVANKNLTFERSDSGNQNVAAFVMAIDEINDKHDGVYDFLLPDTVLRLISNIGEDFSPMYPANNYFEGVAKAYTLKYKDPTLIAAIDSSSIAAAATSTAQTLNNWGILDLISRSTSAAYAHSEFYPLVLQNTPSQTSESRTLLSLAVETYGWKQVLVIFNYDTQVGLDGITDFQAVSNALGSNLLATLAVATDQTDFSEVIAIAKVTGATIFILLTEGAAAGKILEQGHNSGLFHDGTQVITTSTANVDDIRAAFSPQGLANEKNILKGFLTTAPYPEYFFGTPEGQLFVTKFRALPPTITTNHTTGLPICDKRVDDGVIPDAYLYQHIVGGLGAGSNKELCLGFKNFSQFHQDGSNIDPYVLYTYDAVYAYALAADALYRYEQSISGTLLSAASTTHQSTDYVTDAETRRSMHLDAVAAHQSTPLKDDLMHRKLLGDVNLTASDFQIVMTSAFFRYPTTTTGNLSFTGPGGTRLYGNVYKLLNYQPVGVYNQSSEGGLAFVGEYTDGTGWLLCGGETVLSVNSERLCTSPMYRTTNGNPPSDTLPDRIITIALLYKAPILFFASLAVLKLCLSSFYLYNNWDEKHVRRSQPVLTCIVMFGSICGIIKVFLSVSDITRVNCNAQLWLGHICYRLVIRTLLLKIWRVNAIVNAQINTTRIICMKVVLTYIVIDMFFLIVLLTFITAMTSTTFNGWKDDLVTDHGYQNYDNHLIKTVRNTANNQVTMQYFCSNPAVGSSADAINSTILVVDAVYLLSSAYYLYMTRDLPSTIRAAGSTTKGILFAIVVIVITTIATVSLHLTVDVDVFLVNMSFIFIILVELISFFGFQIYRNVIPIIRAINDKYKGINNNGIHSTIHIESTYNKYNTMRRNTADSTEISNETKMIEVLSKETDSRERERACHKQISHWKAMLSLLTEDMIDGSGSYTAGTGSAAPIQVAQIKG